MEITRIFHPVGQGGFYTETFDNQHMVVYDCGGNDTHTIKEYIDSFLPHNQKQTIDAVFISHLHEDHVNGLQYLIERANVKEIILPQLTKTKVLDVLLFNTLHSNNKQYNANDFVIHFIDSIRYENRFGDAEITQVPESNTNRGHIKEYENLWSYIPYNPVSDTPRFANLSKENIRKTLEDIYDDPSARSQAEKIAQLIKDIGVEECRKIYKTLFGCIHNGQSMPVFSGIMDFTNKVVSVKIEGEACRLWNADRCANGQEEICTNFLYTGDLNVSKIKDMMEFYGSEIWDSICGIQIPHHGSRANYDGDLYKGKFYAVASVGSHNKYHHPNIDTLVNIATCGCTPYVVTEDSCTCIKQHFNI